MKARLTGRNYPKRLSCLGAKPEIWEKLVKGVPRADQCSPAIPRAVVDRPQRVPTDIHTRAVIHLHTSTIMAEKHNKYRHTHTSISIIYVYMLIHTHTTKQTHIHTHTLLLIITLAPSCQSVYGLSNTLSTCRPASYLHDLFPSILVCSLIRAALILSLGLIPSISLSIAL